MNICLCFARGRANQFIIYESFDKLRAGVRISLVESGKAGEGFNRFLDCARNDKKNAPAASGRAKQNGRKLGPR